jgi:hypothetical protein
MTFPFRFRFLDLCVLAGVVLVCAGNARAQAMVKGVPYSVTIVHTNAEMSRTAIQKVARASNGSTYMEWVDVRPGHHSMVSILDVPNRRRITLLTDTKTYTVEPAAIPTMPDGQTDDAQLRDRIEMYRKLPTQHFANDGTEGDLVPIGFRTVDGRVEYGSKRTYTKLSPTSGLRQKVWDSWYVPSLYLESEKIGYDDAGNAVNVTKATELQAAEPDAHLFAIPADYTPASGRPIR